MSTTLTIESYSDKSIVIRGPTFSHKDALARLGGKFNSKLKGGSGWIFSNKKEPKVREWLQSATFIDKKHLEEKEIVTSQTSPIPPEVVSDIMIGYMEVKDIVHLCQTCKNYSNIVRESRLWIDLLRRDFKQEVKEDAKEEYQETFASRVIVEQEYLGHKVWKPRVGNYVNEKKIYNSDSYPHVVTAVEKNKQGVVTKACLRYVRDIETMTLGDSVSWIRLTKGKYPDWVDAHEHGPRYSSYYRPGKLEYSHDDMR